MDVDGSGVSGSLDAVTSPEPPPQPPPTRRDGRRRRFALVGAGTVAVVAAAVVGTTSLLNDPVPAGEADAVAPSPSGSPAQSLPPDAVPTEPMPAGPEALVDVATRCRTAEPSDATVTPAEQVAPTYLEASQAAGRALLANPAVSPCPGAGAALASGAVDGRLLALLALTADRWSFRLATIGVYDEDAAVTAVLTDLQEPQDPGAGSGADGGSTGGSNTALTQVPAATAVEWFAAQRGAFRPPVAAAIDDRTVVVSFAPEAAALLPAFADPSDR